jgi:hypothetical protein
MPRAAQWVFQISALVLTGAGLVVAIVLGTAAG